MKNRGEERHVGTLVEAGGAWASEGEKGHRVGGKGWGGREVVQDKAGRLAGPGASRGLSCLGKADKGG